MLKIENAEGTVLAFLNNLTEAKVCEVLNGEYTLSFVATIDHLKTDFLYDENNLINYENDLFRPASIEEIHDEDDALTVAVECEHISYDLIKNAMSEFNHIYTTAVNAMTTCLLGTGFNLRSCDITEKTDIQYTQECNAKQISIAIANNWHGELKYYRYYIDLLKSRGQNRGTGFIFGRNLKSVKRIINRAEGTTSYEVDIVQGSELEELGYYELGDTVRIMDERLNVDYECKIIELEKDILTGINGKVVLGDAIKDMRSSFSSVKKKVDEVKKDVEDIQGQATDWNKIKGITDDSGNIILGKLNELTQIASKIVNSTGTFYQEGGCSVWQDQPTFEASTFATKWSAEGLVFANTKKNNNTEWDWQTAIDANGVNATKVAASALYGITMEAVNLVSATITSALLKAVNIEGGTIKLGNWGETQSIDYAVNITEDEPFTVYKNVMGVLKKSLELTGSPVGEIRMYDSGKQFMKLGMGYNDYNKFGMIECGEDGTDNGLYIRCRSIQAPSAIDFNMSHAFASFDGLLVPGDKKAIVKTEHFGIRSFYCDEGETAYFNHKGVAETHITKDNKYQCIIRLNDIFIECIELNSVHPYIVTPTPYSDARCWVKAVYDKYIVIESDKLTKLGYVVFCMRKGYTKKFLNEVRKGENSGYSDIEQS